eukprot:EG_transcript_21205
MPCVAYQVMLHNEFFPGGDEFFLISSREMKIFCPLPQKSVQPLGAPGGIYMQHPFLIFFCTLWFYVLSILMCLVTYPPAAMGDCGFGFPFEDPSNPMEIPSNTVC